jgi:hypothetical protein
MFRHICPTLAAACLLTLPPFGLAQPLRPRAALLVEVEGAASAFPSIDRDKRTILVPQMAQSRADILTRSPDGSVEATILAIDLTTNRVKARTDQDQVLVLVMTQADLASMRIGDSYTFVVRGHTRP